MSAAKTLAELKSVFSHGVCRFPPGLCLTQSPLKVTSVIFKRDYSIRVNLRDNGHYRHVTLKPGFLTSSVGVWSQQTRGTKVTRYSNFGHKRQKASNFQKAYFLTLVAMFIFAGLNV